MRFVEGFEVLNPTSGQFQVANSGQMGNMPTGYNVDIAKNERKGSLDSVCMHPYSGQSSPKHCI